MVEKPNYAYRLESVCELLSRSGLHAYYTSRLENVRWLCGFEGSSASALITSKGVHLFTDSRYTEYGASLPVFSLGLDFYLHVGNQEFVYNKVAEIVGSACLSLSGSSVTVDEYHRFEAAMHKQLGTLETATVDFIQDLRLIKDAYELRKTTEALSFAEQAFKAIEHYQPGVTEKELQRKLDSEMVSLGADRPSFETIVASGPNSVRPHSTPTDRPIAEGEFVIVDWGAEVDGYKSDTSRTIWYGNISSEQQRIYAAVKQAFGKASQTIADGTTYGAVMQAAKTELAKNSFDRYIEHPFGHNVGLEIHERPFFAEAEEKVISEGCLLALEPAVYVPGFGGVRIENMVYVSSDGPKILNSLAY